MNGNKFATGQILDATGRSCEGADFSWSSLKVSRTLHGPVGLGNTGILTCWVTREAAGINNDSEPQRKLVEYEEYRQHFDLLNKVHAFGAREGVDPSCNTLLCTCAHFQTALLWTLQYNMWPQISWSSVPIPNISQQCT